MTSIEAIYQGGVFRPVGAIELPEGQRVRLRVEPLARDADEDAWWEETRQHRQKLLDKYGVFPDSTPDIAADRMR